LPCTLLLLLPVGIHLYLAGTLVLDRFVFALMLTMAMGVPLIKLLDFIPVIPTLSFKLQELEKTFGGDELFQGGGEVQISNYDIEFDRVSFGYEDKTVISEVSFQAPQGSLTAIVGESGSGKSTLAKLLVHYWDVGSGKILINGQDIGTLPIASLMDCISYVSQDTFLFNITIKENIRLGNPAAPDQAVINAAKAAMCHEFIQNLDQGYDTLAGDAGSRLSGGEKQRITIARAILKNAPVIVLDEATAFTDPENEDKIQQALSRLMQGKTLIVIAHRLSAVSGADNILVMHHGHLESQGRHGELLEHSDIYRRLWQSHLAAMDWEISTQPVQDAKVKGGLCHD